MLRTTRLYTPQPLQTLQCGETLNLETQTSHHLLKVLRAKVGLQLVLFNGDGFNYAATLTAAEGKNALLTLDKKSEPLNESPLNITLLQGLSRGDRMDITLQKSVELGVNNIIPMLCERSNYAIKSDRVTKKMEHWQQIIISACEQSGRATIPKLSDIHSFNEAVKLFNDYDKLILSTDATLTLKDITTPKNTICICIGPEGGLSPEEVSLATENNYRDIQFGPRTLRTETAAPAVISALQTLWGDF